MCQLLLDAARPDDAIDELRRVIAAQQAVRQGVDANAIDGAVSVCSGRQLAWLMELLARAYKSAGRFEQALEWYYYKTFSLIAISPTCHSLQLSVPDLSFP